MRLHRCASFRRTRLDVTLQHTESSRISRMIHEIRDEAMIFILYSNTLASARNDPLLIDAFMEKLCSCSLHDGHLTYVTKFVQKAYFKFSYEVGPCLQNDTSGESPWPRRTLICTLLSQNLRIDGF